MTRYREEVINIRIADILREMGFKATGEIISKGKLPDVMVEVGGIRINIEGRFTMSPKAKGLKKRCIERIEDGIAHIALGIAYPEDLREAENDSDLIKKIKSNLFQTSIFYISSEQFKEIIINNVKLEDIAQNLNHLYSVIISNDILHEQIQRIDKVLKETSETAKETGIFFSSEVVIEKLKKVLGIVK